MATPTRFLKLCIKDGRFPKPIKLGPRAVGWIEAEIEAHNQACIDASRSGTSE
jgi:prophage regulatory protein